ncbi:MAG: hypothetical protein VB099_16430 [Candidatus Limiplasma sp.]|nr:hypothetical protein [Candidatus Limiplasma sp.]
MREIIVDNFDIIKPALFSTPMVQAILADRKSKTRRVVKGLALKWLTEDGFSPAFVADPGNKLSPYAVGDILWVRETWTAMRDIETGHVDYFFAATKLDHDTVSTTYLCDDDGFDTGRPFPWKPSIFMPKKICRLFLRVTDVRVERVQDISDCDCMAEGIRCGIWDDLRDEFRALWDSLNAKRGYGWDTNPWVWVYTFERADKPVGWPNTEPAP